MFADLWESATMIPEIDAIQTALCCLAISYIFIRLANGGRTCVLSSGSAIFVFALCAYATMQIVHALVFQFGSSDATLCKRTCEEICNTGYAQINFTSANNK